MTAITIRLPSPLRAWNGRPPQKWKQEECPVPWSLLFGGQNSLHDCTSVTAESGLHVQWIDANRNTQHSNDKGAWSWSQWEFMDSFAHGPCWRLESSSRKSGLGSPDSRCVSMLSNLFGNSVCFFVKIWISNGLPKVKTAIPIPSKPQRWMAWMMKLMHEIRISSNIRCRLPHHHPPNADSDSHWHLRSSSTSDNWVTTSPNFLYWKTRTRQAGTVRLKRKGWTTGTRATRWQQVNTKYVARIKMKLWIRA